MPLLNSIGAWAMRRGLDLSQPGWVIVLGGLLFPLTVLILAVAGSYELIVRLDRRGWLDRTVAWLLAATAGIVLTLGVGGWLLGYWR